MHYTLTDILTSLFQQKQKHGVSPALALAWVLLIKFDNLVILT